MTMPTRALSLSADLATAQFQEAVSAVLLRAGEGTHTARAYTRALRDFLTWYDANQRDTSGRLLPFSRALVYRYRATLIERGIAASSINQRLAPIRRLAYELSMLANSPISAPEAAAINDVEGVKQQGQRLGNWLTQAQADALINLPNRQTRKGLRDRAILAVYIGSGMRRDEMEHLTVAHIQQREGRWALVDVWGKHHRVRTIPVASWVYVAVRAWLDAAHITAGPIFRQINRGDRLTSDAPMTDQALRNVAKHYLAALGMPHVAPHDLRRTFAYLAYQGGAPIEQIQLSLGHASIKTTERYIGIRQDFTHAPSDAIVMHLDE